MIGMKKWQVRCNDNVTREIYLPECLEAVDQSEIPYYAAKWDFVSSWSDKEQLLDNFLQSCCEGDRALMKSWISDREKQSD